MFYRRQVSVLKHVITVLPIRCVSDDAVYTCECDQGWAGTFCDIPCSLNCGQYGYCSVIGNRKTVGVGLGARNGSGTDDNEKESNENSSNNSITADIVCICHWNRTGANCEATRQIVPKVYGKVFKAVQSIFLLFYYA